MPYITDVFPLGGRRGTTVPVQLQGVNLAENKLTVKVPTDGPPVISLQTTSAAGLLSNPVKFDAGTLDEPAGIRPGDSLKTAPLVPLGSVVNNRIAKPGAFQYYAFTAIAGRRIVVEVRARRLDSPLDSVLTLFDPDNVSIAGNDDMEDPDNREPLQTHLADSRLMYTIAKTGRHVVQIGNAQAKGGEAYAYRLRLSPLQPDFDCGPPRPVRNWLHGATAVVTVMVLRQEEFDGEIHLGCRIRRLVLSFAVAWSPAAASRPPSPSPAPGTLRPRSIG